MKRVSSQHVVRGTGTSVAVGCDDPADLTPLVMGPFPLHASADAARTETHLWRKNTASGECDIGALLG
jgi:hypothetical protein